MTEIFKYNYPRVTTILRETESDESKNRLIRWRKREEKRLGLEGAKQDRQATLDNGTALHASIEACLRGDSIPAHPWFHNIEPFVERVKHEAQRMIIEERVYSHEYKYTGKPDLVALNYDELPTIIDWTTSKNRKRKEWVGHKFLQAGAYSLACKEQGVEIEQLVVVVITADDSPQVFSDPAEQWQIDFLKRLELYNARQHEIPYQ